MDLCINGKNALIFGASRGIGNGIARNLAKEGVNLFLIARSGNKLTSLKEELTKEYGITVNFLKIDISQENIANIIVILLKKLNINIDILVNVSGGPEPKDILSLNSNDYLDYFNEMIGVFIDLTNQLIKPMIKNNWGRIITITSSGVYQPIPDLAISNMLRSAFTSWSKTLANRVAPFGITVNTLVPGRIATERVESIDKQRAEKRNVSIKKVQDESYESIPLNRYGSVAEISSIAVFLAGKPASYLTGNNIRVDGGLIKSTL